MTHSKATNYKYASMSSLAERATNLTSNELRGGEAFSLLVATFMIMITENTVTN